MWEKFIWTVRGNFNRKQPANYTEYQNQNKEYDENEESNGDTEELEENNDDTINFNFNYENSLWWNCILIRKRKQWYDMVEWVGMVLIWTPDMSSVWIITVLISLITMLLHPKSWSILLYIFNVSCFFQYLQPLTWKITLINNFKSNKRYAKWPRPTS